MNKNMTRYRVSSALKLAVLYLILLLFALAFILPFFFYLAGLQDISPALYDAAEVDGASFFQQAIHISVPLLRQTILYNMVTLIIGVFQWFTEPYIMTEGGPSNATMFYSLYLYQNAFSFFKMGYASAQAWIMLLVAMVIIMIMFKVFRFGETEMG